MGTSKPASVNVLILQLTPQSKRFHQRLHQKFPLCRRSSFHWLRHRQGQRFWNLGCASVAPQWRPFAGRESRSVSPRRSTRPRSSRQHSETLSSCHKNRSLCSSNCVRSGTVLLIAHCLLRLGKRCSTQSLHFVSLEC